MNKKFVLGLVFALFCGFFITSCSKDEPIKIGSSKSYNHSEKERAFFRFKKNTGIQSRNAKKYRLTPEVVKVHQFVLSENEKHNFAEGIQDKVGSPLWDQAYTYKSSGAAYYVLIPLYHSGRGIVNGFISGLDQGRGIVLNGLTRQNLTKDFNQNTAIKRSALTILAKQEILIHGQVSTEVDNALCYIENIGLGAASTINANALYATENPCTPELKQICVDQTGGYHWLGGIEHIPLHLDHDQDGIINHLDQDWLEMSARFGITQDQFTNFILEGWEEHMQGEFGDYYEFWDDYGDFYDDYNFEDGSDLDLDGFLSSLSEFWDGIGEWFGDFWYEVGDGWGDFWDGIGDWFDGIFREDIRCPWDAKSDKPEISTRSLECFSFYAWDCGGNSDENWWSFYDGYDAASVLRHRLLTYWKNNLEGQVDFGVLMNLASQSGCDPVSGNFEDCIGEYFDTHRKELLSYFFGQEYEGYDYMPMMLHFAQTCELTHSESNYHACIKSKVNKMVSQFKLDHPEIGASIDALLAENTGVDALHHVELSVYTMLQDAEYLEMVSASIGWSPIMWEIAKELVGDKAVDVMISLVPGFDHADELKDAIKGAKNGNWLEFSFEVGKIFAHYTPWGRMLKIAAASSDMYFFCKKVEKLWDVVSKYSNDVVSRMWDIVKTVPFELRTNKKVVEGFCKAIKRGNKTTAEMVVYAKDVDYLTNSGLSHIFRGTASGGVHHIAALVENPSLYKIHKRTPTSNGCYKATIYKNGVPMAQDKDFFPDDWDEFKVIDEIKFAWPNKILIDEERDPYAYWGYMSNGQRIKIVLNSNGSLRTCFPQ